jgi:hypothetical protein
MIAEPCKMMPERERETGEKNQWRRETQTHGGEGGNWELGIWVSVSADHITTRFRVLALFIPFSSKLKSIPD